MEPYILDASALCAGFLPYLSSTLQGAASRVGEHGGWSWLFADLPLVQQHVAGAMDVLRNVLEADVLTASFAKLSAVLAWLDALSMKSPAELLAAFNELLSVFATMRAWLKLAFPASTMCRMLRENVTSELMMYSAGELILFLIPLVNIGKLRLVAAVMAHFARNLLLAMLRSVTSFLRWGCTRLRWTRRIQVTQDTRTVQPAVEYIDGSPVCVHCHQVPPMAYIANCSHTYCYDCFISVANGEPEFPCLRCHRAVHSFRPARAEPSFAAPPCASDAGAPVEVA